MDLGIEPDGQMRLLRLTLARGWPKTSHTHLDFAKSPDWRRRTGQFCAFKLLFARGQTDLAADWNHIRRTSTASKSALGASELREEELRITIDFAAIRLARLPRSALPGIYHRPTELDRNGRIGFLVSLLVLLAERSQHEYPDVLVVGHSIYNGWST